MKGRTTDEVAAVIGHTVTETEWLLKDEERRGHVVRVDGGWALTASARELLDPLSRRQREQPPSPR